MLSPLLAAKLNNRTDPPKREFVRLRVDGRPEGVHITNQLARWKWAFLEARDALGLDDVSVAAIVPFRYFTVRRTSTYTRKFRRGRTMMSEVFESLPTGQVIPFEFTLSQHLPPHGDGNGRFVRPPDEEEFDKMLIHIGEYLGMSEWGHDYLYGRFKLHNLHEQSQVEVSTDERRSGDDRRPGHTRGQELLDPEVEDAGEITREEPDDTDDVADVYTDDGEGSAGT